MLVPAHDNQEKTADYCPRYTSEGESYCFFEAYFLNSEFYRINLVLVVVFDVCVVYVIISQLNRALH